jgi:hypothetical protein
MMGWHMALPRKRGAMKFLTVGSELVVRNTYKTDCSCATQGCILEQYFTRNTEDSEILFTFEGKFLLFSSVRREVRESII